MAKFAEFAETAETAGIGGIGGIGKSGKPPARGEAAPIHGRMGAQYKCIPPYRSKRTT